MPSEGDPDADGEADGEADSSLAFFDGEAVGEAFFFELLWDDELLLPLPDFFVLEVVLVVAALVLECVVVAAVSCS